MHILVDSAFADMGNHINEPNLQSSLLNAALCTY